MARLSTLQLDTRPRSERPRRPCQCGCGAMTKGGRRKPGHDWQPRDRLLALPMRSWDQPVAVFGPDAEERDAVRLAAESAALDENR